MGGESNPISIPLLRGGAWAAQVEPSRMAAAAAKAVAVGAVAAGRGTRPCVALSARALFQELGFAMAAWHHSVSAVCYPRLGFDCMMGQLVVNMEGVDDVVANDVDIKDTDVARRRRRIRWHKLRSSPRRQWSGRPVAANWEGRQRQRRGSDAKSDKERWQFGEKGGNSTTTQCKRDGGATGEEAMQQPTSTREAQHEERDGGVT